MKVETPTEPVYTLESGNILRLRLICKDWRSGIDHFYETCYPLFNMAHSVAQAQVDTDLDFFEESQLNLEFHLQPGEWMDCDFYPRPRCRKRSLKKFLRHFEATHGPESNPFVGRHVIFQMGYLRGVPLTEGEFSEFASQITELLEMYGRHIWFCNFECFTPFCSVVDYFIKFTNWITLLPNLKVLRMGLNVSNKSVQVAELNQIKCYLDENRLPKMENLQLISFDRAPEFFTGTVLKANTHVRILEFNDGDKIDLNEIDLPNLRHLSFVANSLDDYQLLVNCKQIWNLETLYLDSVENFPYIPWEQFFSLFEKWQDSLTDVMMRLPKATQDEEKFALIENNNVRLNLPNVKRFRVEIPNISSIDFIMPMKSLEVLEVAVDILTEWDITPMRLRSQLEESSLVEFTAYCADTDFYNYNVWKLFPKLKRIHVQNSMNSAWSDCVSFVRRKCVNQ